MRDLGGFKLVEGCFEVVEGFEGFARASRASRTSRGLRGLHEDFESVELGVERVSK